MINPKIDEGIYRKSYEFTEENVKQLNNISILRRAGFSIADIRLMQEQPDQLPAILEERQMILQMEISHNKEIKNAISRLSTWQQGILNSVGETLRPVAEKEELKILAVILVFMI